MKYSITRRLAALTLLLVASRTVVGQRPPATPGFAWERQRDRLSILHNGRPLADYVVVDPEILRPYLQSRFRLNRRARRSGGIPAIS
jgi:hypothetical protein